MAIVANVQEVFSLEVKKKGRRQPQPSRA